MAENSGLRPCLSSLSCQQTVAAAAYILRFLLFFTVASLLIALWQLVLWASVSNPRLGLVSL